MDRNFVPNVPIRIRCHRPVPYPQKRLRRKTSAAVAQIIIQTRSFGRFVERPSPPDLFCAVPAAKEPSPNVATASRYD